MGGSIIAVILISLAFVGFPSVGLDYLTTNLYEEGTYVLRRRLYDVYRRSGIDGVECALVKERDLNRRISFKFWPFIALITIYYGVLLMVSSLLLAIGLTLLYVGIVLRCYRSVRFEYDIEVSDNGVVYVDIDECAWWGTKPKKVRRYNIARDDDEDD